MCIVSNRRVMKSIRRRNGNISALFFPYCRPVKMDDVVQWSQNNRRDDNVHGIKTIKRRLWKHIGIGGIKCPACLFCFSFVINMFNVPSKFYQLCRLCLSDDNSSTLSIFDKDKDFPGKILYCLSVSVRWFIFVICLR